MRFALLAVLACSPDPGVDSGQPTPPLVAPPVSLEEHPGLPTVIEASWVMEQDVDRCWLSYGPLDEDPMRSPERACSSGEHHQLLLGLPAEQDIEVRLSLVQGDQSVEGDTFAATTGPLPDPLLQPLLDTWVPERASAEGWLLLAIEGWEGAYYDGPYYQIIVDRQGRVVWARALPAGLSSTFPRLSHDGRHLVGEQVDRFGLAGGQAAFIERFQLDLQPLSEQEIPGLRFAWDVAEDGSVYYFDREQEAEGWLSRVGPDGARERLFDCVSWIADRCTQSWCCESNAIVLTPERGSVFMSLWASDTVLEIDLDTFAVRHSWGRLEGSWDTSPPEALFELQHYPRLTPDGTLLVGSQIASRPLEHRFREFRIDDEDEVLVELASWGDGWDLFAQYQGEAERLYNGNTLMNFGSAGAVREVTPDGELIWSLTWPESWMLGHMSLIGDLYDLLPPGNDTSNDTPTSTGSGASGTPKRSSTP